MDSFSGTWVVGFHCDSFGAKLFKDLRPDLKMFEINSFKQSLACNNKVQISVM